MLLSVSLLLAAWFSASECVGLESSVCPPWMNPSSQRKEYVCGSGADLCRTKAFHVYLEGYFCIFFSKELNSTLVGGCPNGSGGPLTNNVSEFEDDATFCSCLHCKSQLCGEYV